MQPIGNAWQKLLRIVRDLSRILASRSNWRCTAPIPNLIGKRSTWDQDPLTHMVRNSAADHGLEILAERSAAGKPECRAPSASVITRAATSSSVTADNGRVD